MTDAPLDTFAREVAEEVQEAVNAPRWISSTIPACRA